MFDAPAGYALLSEIGAGSVFWVARVRGPQGDLICKRIRAAIAAQRCSALALTAHRRAAMARELGALTALAPLGGRCVPRLCGAGDDAHGPFWLQEPIAGTAFGAGGKAGHAELSAAFTALDRVHALGVTHGDICPDHVFSARGQVGFIDFGLSRWPGLDPALIGDGERGTLPYVAPEVARGEVAPDQANDVYALAATIAGAALGREPVRAASAPARLVEIGERGCDVDGLARAGLPQRALVALNAALAFDRRGRAATASEVLALLR